MAILSRLLARCVIRGCPVRFRHGADRLCAWHGADDTSVDLATRASGFGVVMSAFDGEHDGGGREGFSPPRSGGGEATP